MAGRLVNRAGAAEYLGLSEDVIRGLVYRRQIPFVKIGEGRGRLYFDVRDLDRWIAEHKVSA